MTLFQTRFFCPLALVCLFFPSCKDKKAIAVYLVSKPTSEAVSASQASMQSQTMPPVQADPTGLMQSQSATTLPPMDLTPTPSANWEAQPLTAMRQASYLVKGTNGAIADISLVTLTGVAGGVLDNVNRWLSQLGQPPISAEQLKKILIPRPSPLGAISTVDLKGIPEGGDSSKDGRIIAGIVLSDSGTYFFKMRGNNELVESQKEAFLQWIGTVPLPVSLPSPVSESSAQSVPSAAPSAEQENPQISWDVPPDWKSVPPSPMRYASFTIAGKNAELGDVSISSFPGDGGGDLSNVNRWRSQIGLSELHPEELKSLISKLSCKNAELQMVDMSGPKGRVLACWTRVDGKSWFFKLSGPDSLIGGEKNQFEAFLRSVNFYP